MDANLQKAIKLLINTYKVKPEGYMMYNGSYIFKAGSDDSMDPFYIVDLKIGKAGHFSPAFDLAGFFEASKKYVKIED